MLWRKSRQENGESQGRVALPNRALKEDLDEEVTFAWRSEEINNLKYAGDTTLMAESEEELKSLLMTVKEESGKAGLKFSIPKTKIMASSPITSRQIDWGKVETVADLIFLGSKITAD